MSPGPTPIGPTPTGPVTDPIPVTVVVMTLDEAANLPTCLAALSRFARVIVVDSNSADDTVAIARAAGAEVTSFRWNGRLPRKKQWCLDNLAFGHDWVFMVDADEEVTPALSEEIARLFADGRRPAHAGYMITGRPVFLGRRLRFGWANAKLALFDRARARFPTVDDLDCPWMWEVEGHFQPAIRGTVGRMREPVIHHDRKPVAAWFIRHARYAGWEADLAEDGRLDRLDAVDTPWRRLAKRIYRRLPLRPPAVFLIAYVVKLGFLDGRCGFHHAVARAFYAWQVDVSRRDPNRIASRGDTRRLRRDHTEPGRTEPDDAPPRDAGSGAARPEGAPP